MKILLNSESVENVVSIVCSQFDVTIDELKSKSQERKFSEPRNILFYIMYRVYKITCAEVGGAFKRDHSTILNGSRRTAGFIQVDKKYEEMMSIIINN